MIIIDADGAERDWEWVKEKYNLPDIERGPKDENHWEVVELKETISPMGIRITTLNMDGFLIGGINALISWPDGDTRLKTNTEGYVDFIMGRPAAYKPWEGEVGPYSVSVRSNKIYSDFIRGMGWRGKTNHAHLNPTFRFMEGEEIEPSPPPPPPDCEEYMSALEKIREIVNVICPLDGLEE